MMHWQFKPLLDVKVLIKDIIAIYITNGERNGKIK